MGGNEVRRNWLRNRHYSVSVVFAVHAECVNSVVNDDAVGAQFTLIASARAQRQLIEHEELLELQRQYPMNFHYHPVLTREWPPDWAYTTGRIIRVKTNEGPSPRVDLSRLLDVVPELERCHLRMCGNQNARNQLQQGIHQVGISPLSFRAEVW